MQQFTKKINAPHPARRQWQLFYGAFGISVMGGLAPGVLNTTTLHLAVNQGRWAAHHFAVGTVCVEFLAVAGVVWLMHRINIPDRWVRAALFITGLVFVVLAGLQLRQLLQTPVLQAPGAANPIRFHPFFSGVFLGTLNPLQVPFWAAWTLYFQKKQLLDNSFLSATSYTSGAVVGSWAAFLPFIFAGHWLVSHFPEFRTVVQWLLLVVFIVMAGLFLRRAIWYVPAAQKK